MKNLDEILKKQIERAEKILALLINANLISKQIIKKEQYEKVQNDKKLS